MLDIVSYHMLNNLRINKIVRQTIDASLSHKCTHMNAHTHTYTVDIMLCSPGVDELHAPTYFFCTIISEVAGTGFRPLNPFLS